MMRRALFVVPAVAGLAGVLAATLAESPLWGAGIGLALGAAAVALLAVMARRDVDEVAARVRALARGEEPPAARRGGAAWERLETELAGLGATLAEQRRDLDAERARVEHLFDAMPTAILLFGDAGLTYANPAGQQLFATRRRQTRSPLQVMGVQALSNAVIEARETGRPVAVEVQRGDRDLSALATRVDAQLVAMVVTDVTDARRLEHVRRDFVTNASHELKTPVAGMQALADSLGVAIDRDPQRARSMIVRVQIEATRLGKLVRELLDLARLEEDHPGERQRVDLADIVRTQVERISAIAHERDVKVHTHIDRPAPVVALPGDLRLIVANLLENAVRYNRPGGRVDVAVERQGSEIILEVEDNGLGIADADRDRVFERFYRVDKARSRAAGGTGLGLSIVRHAVERHGGTVSVNSVLGEGSTFRVVLPVEGTPPDRP
jgi:signal transduction histidine kinase